MNIPDELARLQRNRASGRMRPVLGKHLPINCGGSEARWSRSELGKACSQTIVFEADHGTVYARGATVTRNYFATASRRRSPQEKP
jgi:hypothetical protein